MKTAEELETKLLAENPSTAYDIAVKLTVTAVALGDTEWSEVTAAVARSLLLKGHHKAGKLPH